MNGAPWTADDDETLRLNYADFPTFLVAHVLGRTKSATYGRAKLLGLAKSPEYFAGPWARRIASDGWVGTPHRFPKGHVPANKGLRRPGWSAGRMRETQFKKGRAASESHNYVPIGTEKLDVKRNAIVRKVTDDPSIVPVRRWKAVSLIVWEAAHGFVPAGHVVRFRDGMKTLESSLITVDRLELVSLAENCRRNAIHRYPPVVRDAMRLVGRINREIRKQTREKQD